MKFFNIVVGLLLTFLITSNLNAQKLYTWTDENGILHISDQPPLKKNKVEDIEVIQYEEKSLQELEAIEDKKNILRRKLNREKQIEKARRTEIQARQADERAQRSLQQAREKYEYNDKYIRRLTSTKNKRKKFRKRARRLNAEAEAGLIQAEAAAEQAQKTAQKAKIAAEEASKTH